MIRERRALFSLVVTSADDRQHSRNSLHHCGHALDLDVTPYSGQDVTFAPGVGVNALHSSLWFGVALARDFVSDWQGPTTNKALLHALAEYLNGAMLGCGAEWIHEGGHVHGEYQPKQRHINSPLEISRAVKAALRESGLDLPDSTVGQIAARLIELREITG